MEQGLFSPGLPTIDCRALTPPLAMASSIFCCCSLKSGHVSVDAFSFGPSLPLSRATTRP